VTDETTDRISAAWLSRVLATIIVVMFTTLALWVALGILVADPTPSQSAVIEGVSHICTGCVGCLFGLVGGKLS